jgi:hypothetical protein
MGDGEQDKISIRKYSTKNCRRINNFYQILIKNRLFPENCHNFKEFLTAKAPKSKKVLVQSLGFPFLIRLRGRFFLQKHDVLNRF